MKTIVTHKSVDLDAVASSWLVKRFLPGWQEATHAFVDAGKTLNNKDPDENPDIIHVDTGLGRFDHHQTPAHTCASKLVFEYLVREGHMKKHLIPPLERMVTFINTIDHFGEVSFPEPDADRYEFLLSHFIEGVRSIFQEDEKVLNHLFIELDAILTLFKHKVHAEEDIKNGFMFNSYCGKSLVMETKNEEAIKLALKKGFSFVARKNPEKGNIRIKTLPDKKYDLTSLYEKIIKADPKATWFLHVSKHMLLNSSAKNPHFIPSSLSLHRLIEIIKEL